MTSLSLAPRRLIHSRNLDGFKADVVSGGGIQRRVWALPGSLELLHAAQGVLSLVVYESRYVKDLQEFMAGVTLQSLSAKSELNGAPLKSCAAGIVVRIPL